MTALGQPKLLERVSASLVAIQDLFRIFDADLNGVVTRGEFNRVRRPHLCLQRADSAQTWVPIECHPLTCKHAPDLADLTAGNRAGLQR